MQQCWNCGERLPAQTQMNQGEMLEVLRKLDSKRLPHPGDISICGGCGAFGIFNGLLQIEKPDTRMMRRIYNTPELMEMQAQLLKRL